MMIISSTCNAAEVSKLSIIEQDIFGIEYNEETETKRLNRIEESIFGEIQKGTSEQRIKRIAETSGINFEPKKTQEEKRIAQADITPEASNVSYPIIDMMEEKVFNKNYQGENVYKRVARLEEKVFGKASEGELSDRTDKLKASLLAVKQDNDDSDIIYPQKTAGNNPSYQTPQEYNYQESYSLNIPSNRNTARNTVNPYKNNYNNSYYTFDEKSGDEYGYSTGGAAKTFNQSDFDFALTSTENFVLGKSNKKASEEERLETLEKKLFKKTFNDDKVSRLERIVSVVSAKKNGTTYSENKLEKYLTTGMQIGTILLMILAMVL